MRSAFLTFLTLLFIAPLAQADKLAKYKPPQKFEVEDDFYVIEGAGLVPAGYDGALNVDMWDGSKRAEITKLIKDMPANSPSPAIREMIRAILLSESDTNELDDYDEVIAGEDLLTLRIHKLMEGGFYEEALELYSVAIDIPHHAPIAKAGMLAMLGNGEKSIACLEIKTLGNMDETDPFWSIFIAYCDYTLSETPSENTQKLLEDTPYGVLKNLAFNQDFVFPYSPKDWAAIDVLEQNILIAENRIEAPKLTDELVSTLSAQDIAVLLGLTTFNAQDHLKLQL